MSQAHTPGPNAWPSLPRGTTIVCAIVSALAAIALLTLVGSETAAGAEQACAPGVREVTSTAAPGC